MKEVVDRVQHSEGTKITTDTLIVSIAWSIVPSAFVALEASATVRPDIDVPPAALSVFIDALLRSLFRSPVSTMVLARSILIG